MKIAAEIYQWGDENLASTHWFAGGGNTVQYVLLK